VYTLYSPLLQVLSALQEWISQATFILENPTNQFGHRGRVYVSKAPTADAVSLASSLIAVAM